MAENEEQANLVVAAVNEATATLQEIQGQFESFEGSAQSLGITSVALGGILKDILMKAFEELKDMVKLGINEAINAEQQQVKLMNAFKSEGAAANDSVKSINAMANSLGGMVGIDNDAIVAQAALLRQMTGLSAEAINRCMPAITDLATRTGSLESATTTVARAINGHARGLSMLGIEYKATGDKAKDMETLIGKINDKFGGQAQADMATTGGQLKEMKVIFADTAQEIGNTVIKSELFQFALKKIKENLIGIKEAMQGNLQDKDYMAALTKNTTAAGQAETALANSFVLSDKAMAALTARGEETSKQFTTTEKAKVEKVKLTADQIAAIQKFNLDRERGNAVAILENQAEAYNKDKEARIKRGDELIEIAATDEEKKDFIILATQAYFQKQEEEAEARRLLVHRMVEDEIQRFAMATANVLASTMGQSLFNIVTGTNNSLTAMKKLWQDFGNTVLRMITEMIAKIILFNALTSLASMGTGGIFGFFGNMAKGLFSGQTAEGSTRLVPGPPNMAVPVMAHGGETIGRSSQSGGGPTIVIQGDYYESEEANERIFNRMYNFQKRTGMRL